MIAVAGLALGLGLVRGAVLSVTTIYAPGYDESRFRTLRIGMSRDQVESIMGHPLEKDSNSKRWTPLENWIYSESPPLWDDYWRRWVMFDNDKVVAIVDDYFVD